MNKRDRQRMSLLLEAVAFPWPSRTRTVGVAELSEFYSNVEAIEPLLRAAIMSIARPDVSEPDEDLLELIEEVRRQSPHRALQLDPLIRELANDLPRRTRRTEDAP